MSNTKLWINLRHLIGCQWLCYDKKHLAICKSILIDSLSPHALYNKHETPTYICMNENWNVSWQWVDNELTMSVGCVLILAPLNQIGWPLLWNDAEVDPFNWRKNGWGSIEIEQIQTFWQEGGGGTMLLIRTLPLDPPMIQMACLSSQWWLIRTNTLRMSYFSSPSSWVLVYKR